MVELDSIKSLSLSGLGILHLPYIPSTVEELDISNNNFKKLPKLPEKLIKLKCQNNMIRIISDLPESLKELDCSNNRIKSIDKFPTGIYLINCSYNLLEGLPEIPETIDLLNCSFNNLTKLPNIKNEWGLDISNNPIVDEIFPGVESLNVPMKSIKYKGDDVNIITIPKGTILFRGYSSKDEIISDFVGYPSKNDDTIIPKDYNVFFYPYPFVVENYFRHFNTFAIMVLQYDIQIVSQVYPSLNSRNDIRRNYQYIKPCTTRMYDPCLTDDFRREHPNVVGEIALADMDMVPINQINLEKVQAFKYRKNFMDVDGNMGVPEVILYPFKERQKTKTFSEKDKTFESLNSRIKEYNYVPIIITGKENYKNIVDSLLSPEGYNGMKIKMNPVTHMYYLE